MTCLFLLNPLLKEILTSIKDKQIEKSLINRVISWSIAGTLLAFIINIIVFVLADFENIDPLYK